jgi:hypothetical protein
MRVLEPFKMGFSQVIIPKATPNLGLSLTDLGGPKGGAAPHTAFHAS